MELWCWEVQGESGKGGHGAVTRGTWRQRQYWGAREEQSKVVRGTSFLLSTPTSSRVKPRLPVALEAVWMRGSSLLPCIYLHSAKSAQGTL